MTIIYPRKFEWKSVNYKFKKSNSVNDNTLAAEGLAKFSENLAKFSAKAGENLFSRVIKIPVRALGIGGEISSAAVSRDHKTGLDKSPVI